MMNDDLKKKIYSLMEQAVQDQQAAGVSLLVRKDGEELFFSACGYADIEKQEALGRDHIFRLFSMTKPVTAVAAMILVERGMLDLNMPVFEVLPGFAGAKVMEDGVPVTSQRPVRVLHLLNMTSGLTYGGNLPRKGGRF